MAWARRDLADRATDRPGTRPVLFAHSTYALSPDQLTGIAAPAREFGALLHIHAAENATEVATVEVRHGSRPVELLDSLGLLGPDLLIAHAVDLTGPEIAALARTGTSVAHCPVSNLKLGCGIAPVPRLLSAGVTIGLGTDGAASSNTLDMLGAVRQAALVHTQPVVHARLRRALGGREGHRRRRQDPDAGPRAHDARRGRRPRRSGGSRLIRPWIVCPFGLVTPHNGPRHRMTQRHPE